MKFLICGADVPYDVMDDIARAHGIETPVITQPIRTLGWGIACDIKDFHRETIPTLVEEYDGMQETIGLGIEQDDWLDEGVDNWYCVWKVEYDGYTIIYAEPQSEEGLV